MNQAPIDPERFALFRLSLAEGLGPARLRALLDHFGSAERILRANGPQLCRVDGIGPKIAEAIVDGASEQRARDLQERMIRLGVNLVLEADDAYPPGLREIAPRPAVLSVRGAIQPTDRLAVAIVGSRQCTAYGRKVAERLARELAARGITVVSGLARGIDGAAHQAALDAGGRTIAVLASGLANIYPPEHLELAERIVDGGVLVSEAPLDGAPVGGLFPQRNRLISGMSLGVVVVEAATRSGTLSTARHALEQNREVFAVPGRLGDRSSEGTNRLIQQGAFLVTEVDDILNQLGPVEIPAGQAPEPEAEQAPPPSLNETESKLWSAIGGEEPAFEQLLERTGLRASEASTSLLLMEMRKLVRRKPGNRYERC